jgi:hypothetical protein
MGGSEGDRGLHFGTGGMVAEKYFPPAASIVEVILYE